MNLKVLCSLLNKFGLKYHYKNNILEEYNDGYDDYYIIKKVGNKWVHISYEQEMQSSPYPWILNTFNTESDAAKYFFIEIIDTKVTVDLLPPEKKKNVGIDIYEDEFNEDKFRKGMDIKGGSQSKVSTDDKPVIGRTIRVLKEGDKYSICYVAKNNSVIGRRMLLNSKDILFVMYKYVFTLDFFEKNVMPKLKEEGVDNEFSEENIYAFVTGDMDEIGIDIFESRRRGKYLLIDDNEAKPVGFEVGVRAYCKHNENINAAYVAWMRDSVEIRKKLIIVLDFVGDLRKYLMN
ncbi:MAG: enhanced serine sensitivity protein SseB C-terminal domain-containing protein [Endomicrobium sp.]|jgi:hypothetical protein|nr:enhanced serine sensitivity protein SseB C-terminal domain-containing protein [Endomicrobium sp.]